MTTPKTEKQKRYHREYQAIRYHNRNLQVIRDLGGRCSHCHDQNNLSVRPIEPERTTLSMTKLLKMSTDKFRNELKKYKLVCRNCKPKKKWKTTT